MTAKEYLLDMRDPENIFASGVGFGGPLKLHHVSGDWNSKTRYCVIKWPAYTQWSGRGCREANKTEYWLCEVLEHDPSGVSTLTGTSWDRLGWARVKVLKEITPGRRRKLVTALVEECDHMEEQA